MNLHIDNKGFYMCEHELPALLMLAQVSYVLGCEECIRKAFEEVLEQALERCKKG